MTNIIDYLSPEAKSKLKEYEHSNVGVISVPEENFPSLFSKASKYGRYFIKEYMDDKLIKTSLLLINRDSSDSGNLLGFLRATSVKHASDSFVYKSYDQIEFVEFKNMNIIQVQCDYANVVVKLSTLRSFHSRFTKEW